ncbi:MAG TPA: ankyrin repeat domain-containing protein [Spirochaetota bacterium]|nr:ankyrin repeat domain-containing protein [Spirochaetota bacterium]
MYKMMQVLVVVLVSLFVVSCASGDKRPVNMELTNAANTGDLDKIKKMVEEDGADVNSIDRKGYSTLHHASNKGYLDIVNYLNEKSVNVKTEDSGKAHPLHHAAYMGHIDIVRQLVESGSDVNSMTEKGFTPVERASYRGHIDVVKYLVAKGADESIATVSGDTPLHMAAFAGHVEIVKFFATRDKFDVNVVETRGYTALHYAAFKNRQDVVAVLLENGADATIASADGITALQLAERTKNAALISMIKSKIAE